MRRLWRLSEPEPEKSAQRYNKYPIFANPVTPNRAIFPNKIRFAIFEKQNGRVFAPKTQILQKICICENFFVSLQRE